LAVKVKLATCWTIVVTTFDVAVRETEELSVYVAEAWFPMDVPAAVCWAVAPVAPSSITTARTDKKKNHLVAVPLPLIFVLVMCFSFS